MTENLPTKKFVYPGGREMCIAGKIRAAMLGQEILTGRINLDELYEKAHRGEKAVISGASTNKKNLIHYIVYRHAKSGNLTDYVSENGDFLVRDGSIRQINHPRYQHIVNDIKNPR